MTEKRYIVRTFVMASNAKEAILKAKDLAIDEVYVDDKWLEQSIIKGFEKK